MRAFCSGQTRANTVVAAIAAASCVVVERRRCRRRSASAPPGRPRSRADLRGDRRVVAGDDLDGDAEVGEARQRRGGVGLGGSRKTRKPAQLRSRSSAAVSVRGAAARAGSATATTRLPAANSASSAAWAAAGTSAQRASTASGAPLVTSVRPPSGVARPGRRPSAVRGRTAAAPGAGSASRLAAPPAAGRVPQRGVQRVAADRPCRRRRWRPRWPAAERSGVVGGARRPGRAARMKLIRPSVRVPVLSVNSTSMSPRSSMQTSRLTSTLRRGQPPGAGGQAGGDHRGQQLRGDADRDRQGEQQRVEERPVQHHVDDEDRAGERRRRRTPAASRSGAARPGTRSRAGASPRPERDPAELGRARRWPPPRRGRCRRARRCPSARSRSGRPARCPAAPARSASSTGSDSPVSTDSSHSSPVAVEQPQVGRHDLAQAAARRRRRAPAR